MKYSRPELMAVEEALEAISGIKGPVGELETDPTNPYLSLAAYEVDE